MFKPLAPWISKYPLHNIQAKNSFFVQEGRHFCLRQSYHSIERKHFISNILWNNLNPKYWAYSLNFEFTNKMWPWKLLLLKYNLSKKISFCVHLYEAIMCSGCNTKLNQVVMFLFWSFKQGGVTFFVPSIDEIDIFEMFKMFF